MLNAEGVEVKEGEVGSEVGQGEDALANAEASVDAEAAGDTVGDVADTVNVDGVDTELVDGAGADDPTPPNDGADADAGDKAPEGVDTVVDDVPEVIPDVKKPLTLEMLAAAVRFLAQSQGQVAQESLRQMFPSIFED